MRVVVGIDVATDHLNCVALDADSSFIGGQLFARDELDALVAFVRDADVIGIDAPAELSKARHAEDDTLPPKFRCARCAEIDLGRTHGIWVPWTSPAKPPVAPWIKTGLEVYAALRASVRGEVLEVFPYGAFRVLTQPTKLAKKTAVQGVRQRAGALRKAGAQVADLELWSHDSLDAAVGAVVALQRANGSAVAATCGHDRSAIWLPTAQA